MVAVSKAFVFGACGMEKVLVFVGIVEDGDGLAQDGFFGSVHFELPEIYSLLVGVEFVSVIRREVDFMSRPCCCVFFCLVCVESCVVSICSL